MLRYPDAYRLVPHGPIDAVARVPGSKSMTNRALLAAALADGVSTLAGALVAEDAEVMAGALRALGAGVAADPEDPTRVTVRGVAGRWPVAAADLDLELSGTSLRFLTAAVALGHGRFTLDGNARMRERPIGDLVAALRALGVAVHAAGGDRFPPVTVVADGLAGGRTRVAGDRSSQFLSGLLLAAPAASGPISIEVTGALQSKPFVDVTLAVMRAFGVEVARDGYRRFDVHPATYRPADLAVEGDATAAGYAWGLAVLAGGQMRVANVGADAVQGDKALLDVLARMGAEVAWHAGASELRMAPGARLRGGTFDLNDLPDQAQTLAVIALAAEDPVRIVNVGNLRLKETDRLHALAVELRKFGARVDEADDELTVVPPQRVPDAIEVNTYGDHRMAMAFALAGARWPGVRVRDPGCVAKTYPGFFGDLARWGVGVEAA